MRRMASDTVTGSDAASGDGAAGGDVGDDEASASDGFGCDIRYAVRLCFLCSPAINEVCLRAGFGNGARKEL